MTPSEAQLAEFFARCEDVLRDWNGDTDSMHSTPSKGPVDLARGASYYEQREYATPSVERMAAAGFLLMLVPPMVLAGLVVGTVRAIRGRRA